MPPLFTTKLRLRVSDMAGKLNEWRRPYLEKFSPRSLSILKKRERNLKWSSSEVESTHALKHSIWKLRQIYGFHIENSTAISVAAILLSFHKIKRINVLLLGNPVWKESQWTHQPTIISLPGSKFVSRFEGCIGRGSWKEGNCRSVVAALRFMEVNLSSGGKVRGRGRQVSRINRTRMSQDTPPILKVLLWECSVAHTQLEIAFKARQTCQLAYVTLMLWRDRNLTQHMKEDYKLKHRDG